MFGKVAFVQVKESDILTCSILVLLLRAVVLRFETQLRDQDWS